MLVSIAQVHDLRTLYINIKILTVIKTIFIVSLLFVKNLARQS